MNVSLASKYIKESAIVMLFPLFILGCANPLNLSTKERYTSYGLQAEEAGDYELARENYRRAFINAQVGSLGPAHESQALYNYARMTGFLCNFEEAEETFLEALKLEEKKSGPDRQISNRLFMLAQLKFDKHKYDEAIIYFEQVIPIMEKLGDDREDPVGFSYILDNYAASLIKSNQKEKSIIYQERAKELRLNNSGRSENCQPVSYNRTCAIFSERKGDWEKAYILRKKYIDNLELTNSMPENRALAYYGYGRAAGVVCDFESAEKYLNKAYELDLQYTNYSHMDILELGRLNYKQGKYQKAVDYFKKGVQILEEKGLTSNKTAGFAKVLEERQRTAKGSGLIIDI